MPRNCRRGLCCCVGPPMAIRPVARCYRFTREVCPNYPDYAGPSNDLSRHLGGSQLDEVARRVRRRTLPPLAERNSETGPDAVPSALSRLDDRATGEFVLAHLRKLLGIDPDSEPKWDKDDPDYARKMLALTQALYSCRRLTTSEYVFYAAMVVDRIHGERWFGHQFEAELGPITAAMRSIEKREGLKSDEYWPVGEGPADHQALNAQYEAVLDAKTIDIFREFGLHDLADLKVNRLAEFDRLSERGSRALFHQDELIPAIRDVVARCEREAQSAALAGAYSAAITSLGAAVEGLLLLRCLKSPCKAAATAAALPRRARPRNLSDPTTWTFDNLIAVCDEAGWMPQIETEVAQYDPSGLAHILRGMRNYVHPGRYARQRPWTEPDEREYKDAEAIYILMLAIVGRSARGLLRVREFKSGVQNFDL